MVGCIGGVGAFLGVTGINVATRLDEGVAWSFRYLFESDILVLWVRFLLLLSRSFPIPSHCTRIAETDELSRLYHLL